MKNKKIKLDEKVKTENNQETEGENKKKITMIRKKK